MTCYVTCYVFDCCQSRLVQKATKQIFSLTGCTAFLALTDFDPLCFHGPQVVNVSMIKSCKERQSFVWFSSSDHVSTSLKSTVSNQKLAHCSKHWCLQWITLSPWLTFCGLPLSLYMKSLNVISKINLFSRSFQLRWCLFHGILQREIQSFLKFDLVHCWGWKG